MEEGSSRAPHGCVTLRRSGGKLQHKLDRATAALKPSPATKPPKAAASAGSTNEPSTAYGLTAPDETWTVVQLRAEAHARGLTGMSDKTKDELLAALT